jgi:hypothetical protein
LFTGGATRGSHPIHFSGEAMASAFKDYPPLNVAISTSNETDLLGKDGADVDYMDRAEFNLQVAAPGGGQSGSQAVIKVYYQYTPASGWTLETAGALSPTVAPGASARLVFSALTAHRLRITATAPAGAVQITIDGRAVRIAR